MKTERKSVLDMRSRDEIIRLFKDIRPNLGQEIVEDAKESPATQRLLKLWHREVNEEEKADILNDLKEIVEHKNRFKGINRPIYKSRHKEWK